MIYYYLNCSRCKGFIEAELIGNGGYCRACRNEYMRRYKLKNPQILKEKVRSKANTALQKGVLIKKPCEKCGNEKSEMHHPDYDKPLEVTWLCRKHHLEVHKNDLTDKV